MNCAGFQAALAHLLVDGSLRKQLELDKTAIQQRFSLSEDEIRTLGSFDRSRLQLMADAVAGKRLQLLRRGLPTTVAILEGNERGRALLQDFLISCVPLLDGDQEMDHNRLLADSRRMAEFLVIRRDNVTPSYLAALSGYEAMRIGLALGIQASLSAAAALTPDHVLSNTCTPRIGSHVALRAFEYDVVSIASEAMREGNKTDLSRRTTYIALRRQAGSLAVTTYRVGSLAFEALRLCNGSLTVADICASIGSGERARHARTVLRLALERGYFVSSDKAETRIMAQ